MTKQETVYKKWVPTYGYTDFLEIETELKQYEVTKDLPVLGNMEKKEAVTFVPVAGYIEWYISKGAMKKYSKFENSPTIINIDLYEELREKLDQYNKWKGKKEYAIKMNEIAYEKDYESIIDKINIGDDSPDILEEND